MVKGVVEGSLLGMGTSLYLSYFGVREPLVQTQVIPYLRNLTAAGYQMHLLTFERPAVSRWKPSERDLQMELLAESGIRWHYLTYHQRPTLPATMYDVWRGTQLAVRLVRRFDIDLLHARSHVAALIGAQTAKNTTSKLLFDIRGFFPEEYVDAGRWKSNGLLYRLTKSAERRLFAAADGAVVLTERARQILSKNPPPLGLGGKPIQVIPCCVDLERFKAGTYNEARTEVRASMGLTNEPVLAYVGALDGWYLTDQLAELIAIAHRTNIATFSLILTQSDPTTLSQRLRQLNVPLHRTRITSVAPTEVPRFLSAADFGVSLIKRCYSKQSSSPTKFAEYLAAGLPVLTNTGIGDLDTLVRNERVGVLVEQLDRIGLTEALERIRTLYKEPGTSSRCRSSAFRNFDLNSVGGLRYRQIYDSLLGGASSHSLTLQHARC